MSHKRLTAIETQVLQEALNADYRDVNIRLREGEYQYDLAKTIAVFQLKPTFPDVRDIIRSLYGEEKTSDIQFIRKIQTILKKMERSNIVAILPKKNPWDLQRYALSSFRFQDVDKNRIVLATEEQVAQTRYFMTTMPSERGTQEIRPALFSKITALACIITVLYVASLWALMMPTIEPLIFIPAFTSAVFGSLFLGKILSRR